MVAIVVAILVAIMVKSASEQPVLAYASIEGEDVLLRPVLATDADAAYPLIHERPEVLDWLVWQGPDTVDVLRDAYGQWIKSSDNGHDYQFAVIETRTGAFAGTICLRFVDHPFVGDIGYWLGRPFWGSGLMTEAVFLVGHLAVSRLAAKKLFAEVFLGNDRSCRVLEKNGYERSADSHPRVIEGRPDREEWAYELARERYLELADGRAGRIETTVRLAL